MKRFQWVNGSVQGGKLLSNSKGVLGSNTKICEYVEESNVTSFQACEETQEKIVTQLKFDAIL